MSKPGVLGQGVVGVRGEATSTGTATEHFMGWGFSDAAGVSAEGFSYGVGVKGHSQTEHGIVGMAEAGGTRGVMGLNSYDGDDYNAYGVYGECTNAPYGVGVKGSSVWGIGE